MMPKIAVVGSSSLIANEIHQLLVSLLQSEIPIQIYCTHEVKDASRAQFYLCARTQYDSLCRVVPSGRIFILELTPTSAFFLRIARIPAGETVYVFNNQRAYAVALGAYCQSIGITHLVFEPIAFEEMSDVEISRKLRAARWIVGVDRFVGMGALQSDPYKKELRADVTIIAGKRTISIRSSCAFLHSIAAFYLRQGQDLLTAAKVSQYMSQAAGKQVQSLVHEMDKIICLLRAAAVQTVANQVGLVAEVPPKKSMVPLSNLSADEILSLLQDQVRMLYILSQKLAAIGVDE